MTSPVEPANGENSPGLAQQAMASVAWSAGSSGGIAVLRIGLLALLARLLERSEFGVMSAALVVIGLATIVSGLGMGPALVQRPTLLDRHVRTAFTTSLVVGVAFGAAVWALRFHLENLLGVAGVAPVLGVLAFLFPLRGINVVADFLTRRDLNFEWLAKRELISYAGGYAPVGVIAAASGWGVWSLVLAHFAQTIVSCSMLLWRRPPPRGRPFDTQSFLELVRFGGGISLGRIAQFTGLQADNVVVGRALGADALGVYGRAYQLITMPSNLFGDMITKVMFPTMAKFQHDRVRLGVAFRRGSAAIAHAIVPIAAAGFVLAPDLVRVVLGPGWSDAIDPLRFLLVGLLFRTSVKMTDALYRATGAVSRGLWRQVAFAAMVLAGASTGSRWGLVGVSAGVTIAYVANFFLMTHLSIGLTTLRWTDIARAHLPPAMTAVVVGATCVVSQASLNSLGVPSLIVLVASPLGALLVALGCFRSAPQAFLGRDGLWMLHLTADMVGVGPAEGVARWSRERKTT